MLVRRVGGNRAAVEVDAHHRDAELARLADERVLNVTITEQGEALKEQAVQIPRKMQGCVSLDKEEAQTLYRILNKILERS